MCVFFQSIYSTFKKVRYSIRQSWSSCFSINKHKDYCKRLHFDYGLHSYHVQILYVRYHLHSLMLANCVFFYGFNICNKSRCEGWHYPTSTSTSKCDGVIVARKDVASFFPHHHHNSWNIVWWAPCYCEVIIRTTRSQLYTTSNLKYQKHSKYLHAILW